MGLYNNVICHYPLPDLPEELKNEKRDTLFFQTKDLDPCLKKFEIDKDGFLYEYKYDSEIIEYSPQEIEEQKKNKTFLFPFFEEQSNHRRELFPYTGEINFYTNFKRGNFEIDGWAEYKAIFISGQIINLLGTIKKPRNLTKEEKEKNSIIRKEFEKNKKEREIREEIIDNSGLSDKMKSTCKRIIYCVSDNIEDVFVYKKIKDNQEEIIIDTDYVTITIKENS